ncbi:MAG: LLM class F420-dependent oxidoreductase [SAR202 cluster bacterium]|nr:LLM class F420-dependent oxidoreductase [SAR202 cluster bacterium]
MKFGTVMPTRGPLATQEGLTAIARKAESLGFDTLSISDHIVIPKSIDSRYPYSQGGEYPGDPDERDQCLEQLTTVMFLAGIVSKPKLLTSVMVVPYRSPMHTAKILATIDQLSGGRLVLGVGAGWMREEFEAVGAPDYDRRGAVTDEYIRAFKELWTSPNPSFEGEFCSFSDIAFEPKPLQKPYPPIWTGGESPPALRRAGRYADVWFPIGSNPTFPVDTPQRLRQSMTTVRRHAEEAGRNPEDIGVAYATGWYNEKKAENGPQGKRRMFTGSTKQIADDFKAFAAEGVDEFLVSLLAKTLKGSLERMEHFANEVRPLVEGRK